MAWIIGSRLSRRVALLLLTAGALFIAQQIVSGQVSDLLNLEGTKRATGDLSGRTILWERARYLWEQHQLLGIGPGSFRLLNESRIGVHNEILETAVGLGAVGVVIYLWFLWATLGRDTRGAALRGRALVVGAFVAVSAPLMLSGVWLPQPSSWVLLAMVPKVVLVARRQPQGTGANLRELPATETGLAAPLISIA